ncbi:MAG: dihydroneopterin aldolase family protein [Halanaeroarchaeum sp.]
MPSDAETAAFEVGIKFGALYHQFAGTPVSAESAPSLERSIEESIENQPHAETVEVRIDTDAVAAAAGTHGYAELTGALMDVDVVVTYRGTTARAQMRMVDGYPLMELTAVESS